MRNSSTRHPCEHLRSHARRMIPLAPAFFDFHPMRTFTYANAARRCAPVQAEAFPGRLRSPFHFNHRRANFQESFLRDSHLITSPDYGVQLIDVHALWHSL